MLKEVSISNFKSLKNVTIKFGQMAFFCGPNACGKSNLAEAFDFISQVFRNGLQHAVAEKGGFYNICFRHRRRTKGSIYFRIVSESKGARGERAVLEVTFAIKARTEAIRAEFVVESEEYFLSVYGAESSQKTIPGLSEATDESEESTNIHITRTSSEYVATSSNPNHERFAEYFGFRNLSALNSMLSELFVKPIAQQLLLTSSYGLPFNMMRRLRRSLRDLDGLRVFQLNPRTARQAGTPSVLGGLGRHGENLPVVVDTFLRKSTLTRRLLSWMKDVIPDLLTLDSGYTETKQIGLFLHEQGFGLPWYAEDLSDGTIMTLGLFICLLEPTYRTVLIEEPENSLHPWILKRFLDRCREVSQQRQILITTHSPLVVAAAEPEELFLMERRDGLTEIFAATDADPALSTVINKQMLDLGEYWLSGGLGAVPQPSDDIDEQIENDNPESEASE
jgi:predicted ATPase